MTNKKFFIWLIVSNVILIVIIIILGFIFIHNNHDERFYLLGRGIGTSLAFLDLGLMLIYFFWYKKRQKNK
ncbi:MAG: hypothetical protein JXA68_02765 [Ignavibacteriales bacterium]|nr:hypothetical protein [Ignavibacteriales bacterium]